MNSSDQLQQWRVGDVRITRIPEIVYDEGIPGLPGLIPDATPEALRSMPWLFPHFVSASGNIRLSIHALLVQTPALNILVDGCVGNDKPRPLPTWDRMRTPFLQLLERTGCSRQDVHIVLCTHMHVDHMGWNTLLADGKWTPTFPNARHLFARQEYDYWLGVFTAAERAETRSADDAFNAQLYADSLKPVIDAGLVDLVDDGHEVCAGVRLVPTPGHTPGHVSIAIESAGARAFITGDMVHHPCQIANPHWSSSPDYDRAQATRTRTSVFEGIADSGTLVVGTHFAGPTAGRVVRVSGGLQLHVDAARPADELS